MPWTLIIDRAGHEVETRTFERPRDAWDAFRAEVAALGTDGFVAGGVETLSYGHAWVEQLTSPSGEKCWVTVEAEP